MPSADRDGLVLPPLPLTPASEVEARVMSPGDQVLHVDVGDCVGVGRVEVGGEGVEGDLGAVGRQSGAELTPLPLTPVSEVEARVMSPVTRSLT